METKYSIKLNGCRPSHRNKWRLIQENVLSLQELSFWQFCIDNMDFDQRHDKFSTFVFNANKFADIFNCCPNTIRNWKKALLEKGLLEETEERMRYKIKNPKRYIQPGKKWQGEAFEYAKKESDISIVNLLKNIGVNTQSIKKTSQSIVMTKNKKASDGDKVKSRYLGSYKDESNNPSNKRGKTYRTDEEYKEMLKGNFSNSSVEELKLMDKAADGDLKIEKNC